MPSEGSSERSSVKSLGCMALAGLPFAAVGVFTGYLMGVQILAWHECRDWVEVPATIERVVLDRSASSDGTTYSVEARYGYEFEGQRYVGTRVWLEESQDNVGSFHLDVEAELERHRQSGEPFTAYVDPENPGRAILYRDLRPGLLAFLAMFTLLFGGVGFGLLAALPYVRRRAAAEEQYQQLHPTQPWMWKKEWRDGTLRASAREATVLPVVFALVWNLISWPMILVAAEEIFEPENRLALVALVFPLVGILLAVWALRALARWRKFGDSTLELGTFPVPAGGRLTGRLKTRWRFAPDATLRLRLSCHASRGEKSSDKRVTWQEEFTVPGREGAFDGVQSSFPVSIPLPADARETEEGAVAWKLEAFAPTRGVDYSATFEIPVYGRALPERREEAAEGFEPEEAAAVDLALVATPGIAIEPLAEGGTRYVFARARQKWAAASLTLFFALWTGVVYLLWRLEGGCFFVVFALTDVLVFLGVLDLWLTARTVTASRGGLRFRSGFLALGRRLSVSPEEIETLDVERGMQSGNKLYYRLLLNTRQGKSFTLADKLDSRGLAQALARAIRRDLEG